MAISSLPFYATWRQEEFWCFISSSRSPPEWDLVGWEGMPRPPPQKHAPVSHLFSFPRLSFLLLIKPNFVRWWITQLFSQSPKSVVHVPHERLKVKSQEFDSGSTVLLLLPWGSLSTEPPACCGNGGDRTRRGKYWALKLHQLLYPNLTPHSSFPKQELYNDSVSNAVLDAESTMVNDTQVLHQSTGLMGDLSM